MGGQVYIHPSAEVAPGARIGAGTRVWHQAHVREGAVIGRNCIVGKDVYVDAGVVVGDNVKIQNGALLYHGVTLEDGVFIGPLACLTNDRLPRAINPDGSLKAAEDWSVGLIRVRYGATVGAGAVVLPDVTIGSWALVGAGAIVTADVRPHALVVGNPARLAGYVCACGGRLVQPGSARPGLWVCSRCGQTTALEETGA